MDKNNQISTMKVKDTNKDIYLKILSKDLFNKFNSEFTIENTTIIDDSQVKHIVNDSENVLQPVFWLHNKAGESNTFLIDLLVLWLQHLYRSEDIRLASKVYNKISQPILFDDPFSMEYEKIQEAIDIAHILISAIEQGFQVKEVL